MPLTFGRDILDEGEFAQLVCIVSKGDEPLTITWSLKGDDISSEPGLTTATLGTRTSMLTINSVGYRHSGTYTCMAKNAAGAVRETAELKVNGNFYKQRAREVLREQLKRERKEGKKEGNRKKTRREGRQRFDLFSFIFCIFLL